MILGSMYPYITLLPDISRYYGVKRTKLKPMSDRNAAKLPVYRFEDILNRIKIIQKNKKKEEAIFRESIIKDMTNFNCDLDIGIEETGVFEWHPIEEMVIRITLEIIENVSLLWYDWGGDLALKEA